MSPNNEPSTFPLTSSEAIFAVADVRDTVKFYRELLGFDGEWLWGNPPSFGGVRWGKVSIMLCRQPELAAKMEGHQHYFAAEDINGLYERHRAAGAPIISDIGDKPWSMREYTVRDINGYHLRFGGRADYQRPPAALDTLPGHIRIVERMPTLEEYETLAEVVGWNKNSETVPMALANSLYAVMAEDTKAEPWTSRQATRGAIVNRQDGCSPGSPPAVGMLRIVGDGARFFYIQDVMVMPQYQAQRIGSAMMEAAMSYLRRTAPTGAFIGLFTGKPGFYERYGFQTGHGMSLCL